MISIEIVEKGRKTLGAFRAYLIVVTVCLGAYTLVVGFEHGCSLLPIFFGDIAAMNWPGQFNCDSTSFLSPSALSLAWRHHFSPGGLALGVAGFFGGMMVLAPYLFLMSLRAKGDAKELLLGKVRAG